MTMSFPKSLFGILAILLILGFFVSSLTGHTEVFSWHPPVTHNSTIPYSQMSIWDKLGYLADLPISVIETTMSSIGGLSLIFSMVPPEFEIIKALFGVAIILYLVGRFIK